MASSTDLKAIYTEAYPLIEQQLDLAELVAGLRDKASAIGLDWSQIKALCKAQIQDERDDGGNGKRVARIVEKAEHASAYADMLGLANMNEKNFSARQSYAQAKGIDVPSRPGQDVQSPIQRASADENLDVTAGETATKLPLQTSPETGSAGDPSPTSGQMDLVEAGTGQNCAVLPQEPCTAQITPSAATPAEPEAVSPTPPAASGTIPPSSDSQEVPGGNLGKPSPDAGAEDGSAHAGHSTAQSEQAAHHSDDDVPAFLKQERAERQPNPKCQKPGDCKWDHGQVSCWRCNSAPAARESEVA